MATATAVAGTTVSDLRRRFDDFKPNRPNPDLHRELTHGWMLPALVHLDQCLWGRWDYWEQCYEAGELPPEPIPRLEFLSFPHAPTRRMLEASLDCIPQHGSWRTWSGWSFFDYFLAWVRRGSCNIIPFAERRDSVEHPWVSRLT